MKYLLEVLRTQLGLQEKKPQTQPAEMLAKRLRFEIQNLVSSSKDLKKKFKRDWSHLSPADLKDLWDSGIRDQLKQAVQSSKNVVQVKFDNMGPYPRLISLALVFDKMVDELAKRYGWFVLMRSPEGHRSASWAFGPNYTDRMVELPKVLYHATPIQSVFRILKKGLEPRSGQDKDSGHVQRKYPNRVYVFSSKALAAEFTLNMDPDAMMAAGTGTGRANYRSMYVILKIDTGKLAKGTKFFVDPEFTGPHKNKAWWTYSRIPLGALSASSADMKAVKEYEAQKDEEPF